MGEPFLLSPSQEKVFEYIYDPKYRRVAIKTVTQFGKSDVTSMAIIHSLIDRPEKILIVSPSIKQSEIIMGYIIDHLFDHDDIKSLLEVDEPLARLKRERSKQRITLKNGSEVAILTADARTVSQEAKGLMGFGASTVVVDESAIIPDEMYGKIFRMVGGTGGKIVQLGNPFPSKHFSDTFDDPTYTTLTVDWRQAVAEGRFTKEYIEEARRTITHFDFTVFYDCIFPRNEGDVFRDFMPVMCAMPQKPLDNHIYVMGVDLARVTDYTVISVFDRMTNAQVYQKRFNELDWVTQRSRIKNISKLYNNALVVLDASGLGDPIAEDLIRQGVPVSPVRISAPVKTELIEKLSIAIEQRMIKIINMPETRLELEKFTYTKNSSGYIKYEARQGYHDDIVTSLALAVRELLDTLKVEEVEEVSPVRQHFLKITSEEQSDSMINW